MPKLIKCKVERIISGGQNGADIGGLIAARLIGLKTGGWIPKGFKTLDGPCPEYQGLYGLKETPEESYPPRTVLNVQHSDGTVRFATNWHSPGELCTLKAIKRFNKPRFDVPVGGEGFLTSFVPFWFWLLDHRIQVLNVAGNSASISPGIEQFVVGFLLLALNNNYAKADN